VARAGAAYLASGAVHAALIGLIARLPPPAASVDAVAVEVVETAPPPLPPEPAPPPPQRRPPRHAALTPPPEVPRPPAPSPEAPPPPNEPPPSDASPPARAPVRIGVSMSSTATGGTFAAPVGNTLYGQAPRTAPAPPEVQPYRAENYVPPTQVQVMPRLIGGPPRLTKEDYPPEAMRLGLEARVRVMVAVDDTGRVTEASAIDDPGHGFAAAAVRIVKKYYRFEPARRGDEPVATRFPVPIVFEIP